MTKEAQAGKIFCLTGPDANFKKAFEKKTFAKDLTNEQQKEFVELFVELSPIPCDGTHLTEWATPWHFGGACILHGDTVERMVECYIESHRKYWDDLIARETEE